MRTALVRIPKNKKAPERPKIGAFRRFAHGALQGTRTPDLLVRSQTLYPAELAAHLFVPKYTITNGSRCQVLLAKNFFLEQKS